eukprot:TRINITY_DN16401_c0_g1_i1.p1 TRINITY_DN16401_c0_g1~~TRINITY_DN16401_c0_g1_i1.p1  ORF type:complete len:581 (-),score=135.90 TRINITY_DN16401_c0_g1_i1:30-1772(-)
MAPTQQRTVCSRCGCTEFETDPTRGATFCPSCGLVLEENAIISQISFAENENGRTSVIGTFVPSDRGPRKAYRGSSYRDSREASLDNAKRLIQTLASALKLNQHQVEAAQNLFKLALHHNFSRGRRSQNVIASCVYIVCRREKTPHLLIDFSDILQINVYALGHTFLSFCRLLNLHLPIIDPSLYIPRFAAKLEFEDKTKLVANTAIRLVARMKRDWIQTGRRPSGICGAGLLIAARLHGFRRTQKEIIRVVRICDTTLRRRLAEFQETPSAYLTPQEFEVIDLDEECNPPSFRSPPTAQPVAAVANETESSVVTSQPLAIASTKKSKETEVNGIDLDSEEIEREMEDTLNSEEFIEIEKDFMNDSEGFSLNKFVNEEDTPSDVVAVKETGSSFNIDSDATNELVEDDEDLSDIRDSDVMGYLHSEEEVRLKTALWHAMNKDYLEQQVEKEKEEARNRAAGKPPKKKRKRETKKSSVAETAAEATMAVLKKKVSTKINYAALEDLFNVKNLFGGASGSSSGSSDLQNSSSSQTKAHHRQRGFDDQETAAMNAGLSVISEAYRDNYYNDDYYNDDYYNDDD